MENRKQNPVLPSDCFVPDVEAHVWEDGRIYLYGSWDVMGQASYCSDRYHVFSSADLVNWVDHGVAFSLSDTEWARDCGALYAPDCAFRDGIYYLYYCVPDGRCGVAVSRTPQGPFRDVGVMASVQGIDPAVLIDEDGQAYLYWGQYDNVRVAKLKENMIEICPETIHQPLSVAEHEFHEGSSVKKIDGRYYYLFTDTHRHGRKATCLGYAVSDHPMKGFRYGGVILDNFGCDKGTWNNHGSLACFQGQWYLFYHRSTHGFEFSRRVCAEPIHFLADGSIAEVKMTLGMGAPYPARCAVSANRVCEISGLAYLSFCESASDTLALTAIRNGDTATFRSLAFDGENGVSVRLFSDKPCRVELYLDDFYYACLRTPSVNTFQETSAFVTPLFGSHTLVLKFYGDFESATLDGFSFFHANELTKEGKRK